jgi:integrase
MYASIRLTAELGRRHAPFEEGLIDRNPTIGVRVRRFAAAGDEQEKAKALTPAELHAILEVIPPAHELLFSFLARTGLRVSEALALRWADVEGERIHVRRRFYKGEFAPPKSKHGRRSVPIVPELARDLWAHRKTSPHKADEDLVFANRRGEPLDRVYLFNRVLKPAAENAGVPWAGFHTFRHTCLTQLLRAGLSPKQVQLWAGHHSAAFTLTTYVHLLPEDLPATDVLAVALPISLPTHSAVAEPETENPAVAGVS